MYNDTKSLSRCNVSADLIKDVNNYVIVFALKEKTKTNEYDKVITGGSLNSCKLQRGILGSVISKITNQMLTSDSNFKVECPQKKRLYYIRNAPLSDMDIFPGFMLTKRTERMMSFKVFDKAANQKTVTQIMMLDSFFTIDLD